MEECYELVKWEWSDRNRDQLDKKAARRTTESQPWRNPLSNCADLEVNGPMHMKDRRIFWLVDGAGYDETTSNSSSELLDKIKGCNKSMTKHYAAAKNRI